MNNTTPVLETPSPGSPLLRVWRLVLFIVFVAVCQASLSTPVAAEDKVPVNLSNGSDGPQYGAGSDNDSGPVNGGILNVTGGHHSGFLYGGRAKGVQVVNCKVNFSGGSAHNMIRGAFLDQGEAFANQVNVTGGEARNYIDGAYVVNGKAYMNSVTVSDGSVAAGIWGAKASAEVT
ncbi:MAG: hypothetical protein LBF41_06535, partial [Deltaproteobacteria bacterium]|nr:hypothetical protein [Deltaproteobacteria bacterium]